jgi:hypothetical protein
MDVDILEPTETVTYFPSLTKEGWMDITREWMYDTDFDDLFDSAEDDKIDLSYQIVTAILLTLFKYQQGFKGEIYKVPLVVEYVKEGINADFDEKLSLKLQIDNIKELFYTLIRYPVSTRVPRLLKSGEVVLYRGFRKSYDFLFDKLDSLNKLQVGKEVTLPTFMSTSLLEDTAMRFSDRFMWKIIVPEENRGKFKYTNLYDDNFNLEHQVDLQNSEVEFLLNIGTVLKCTEIVYKHEKTFPIPMIQGDPIYQTKTVTMFVYEFQRHKRVNIDKFLEIPTQTFGFS